MSEEGTQQLVVPSQGPDLREQLPRIALKQPDKFTGRRDIVERFIMDTNNYFTNVNVAPHRQLGLTKSFLCKELRDWFDLRMKRGMGFADWPALREVLRRRYNEKHERRKARKQVLSLRCTGTVDDYNKEFSLLTLKITNASEEDLVEDYIEGLPPGIIYETDRMEPATLNEAMEKALDSEIWLKQASSRSRSRWSRGPPSDPSPVIDPTGPAPMELCGVGVRPSRRLPPRYPLIPQTVWESRGRLNRCLLCGENTHMMAACRNGPQLPPHMRTIQTTSQSRSPWPPRASPGFTPFVPGFEATPGYPWPPPPYPSLPFPYPINQVTQPTGGRGRSGQRGDSPSSPMSPGRGFSFGDRRRTWSPSFGESPQPQPSGHQPARKAGSRRVAGVRTIRGQNENDETVVEPDLTVWDPDEM